MIDWYPSKSGFLPNQFSLLHLIRSFLHINTWKSKRFFQTFSDVFAHWDHLSNISKHWFFAFARATFLHFPHITQATLNKPLCIAVINWHSFKFNIEQHRALRIYVFWLLNLITYVVHVCSPLECIHQCANIRKTILYEPQHNNVNCEIVFSMAKTRTKIFGKTINFKL